MESYWERGRERGTERTKKPRTHRNCKKLMNTKKFTMSPSKIWSMIWWRGNCVPSISNWKTNSRRGSISPRRAFRSHSSRRLCASTSSDIFEVVWFYFRSKITRRIVSTINFFYRQQKIRDDQKLGNTRDKIQNDEIFHMTQKMRWHWQQSQISKQQANKKTKLKCFINKNEYTKREYQSQKHLKCFSKCRNCFCTIVFHEILFTRHGDASSQLAVDLRHRGLQKKKTKTLNQRLCEKKPTQKCIKLYNGNKSTQKK